MSPVGVVSASGAWMTQPHVLTERGAYAHQAGHQEGEAPRLPLQHQLELRHAAPHLGGPRAQRRARWHCRERLKAASYTFCPRKTPVLLSGTRGSLVSHTSTGIPLDNPLGAQGDNDPVDVVEIGCEQLVSGQVYKIKVLGAYAMIDEGELDWKIIAIRADDPMAQYLDDIDDVERCCNPAVHRHCISDVSTP